MQNDMFVDLPSPFVDIDHHSTKPLPNRSKLPRRLLIPLLSRVQAQANPLCQIKLETVMHGISMMVGRIASAFCVMLAIGGTAAAQEAERDAYSVKISLRGIDLSTTAGREQAAQRMAYAVRRDYRSANVGSVIPATDAAIDQDATLALAMSRLQQLEAAASGQAPFAVAASGLPR